MFGSTQPFNPVSLGNSPIEKDDISSLDALPPNLSPSLPNTTTNESLSLSL